MNKEQQELLNDAYENYSKEYEKDNSIGMCLLVARMDGKKTYRKPNKEMFVGLCTSDKTFSERWGLQIEERELSNDERFRIAYKNLDLRKELEAQSKMLHYPDGHNKAMDNANIPTKLITITYNDKKIESYE
jgi:hypothetical protein